MTRGTPTHRPLTWQAVAALALLAPLALAQAQTAAATPSARVIVKYRADAAVSHQALAEGAGMGAALQPQHARRLKGRARYADLDLADGRVVAQRVQVLKARGLGTAALLARLRADPDVEYAEEDLPVRVAALPDDPRFAANQPAGTTPTVGQWYLRANGGEVVSAINAQGAWDLATGRGIVVAVIDTGVRPEHPDLQGKLLTGYDFVSADANGGFTRAADRNGPDNDPTDPGDDCGNGSSWHGTQVAGLVGAASNNRIGIAGTAWDAMVLPVRALGRCGGFSSDIVAAMRWAGGVSNDPFPNPNPARVINLSLGADPDTSVQTGCGNTFQQAVTELVNRGVVVVAAAGNGVDDNFRQGGVAPLQPANCTGAIGVAGVRHTGTKVGYSNLGSQLAVAAPAGNCVNNINVGEPCLYPLTTTSNSGRVGPENSIYTGSAPSEASIGTSFASPLVAGTVAMVLQANPGLNPAQVNNILRQTARPFLARPASSTVPLCGPPDNALPQLECYCTTSTCGAGMLDAFAAVQLAATGSVPLVPGVSAQATPANPEVGGVVSLTGAAQAPVGRSITAYLWTLVAGGDIATLSGETTLNAATVVARSAGTITAMLTVTDSQGAQASASVSFTVTNPQALSSGGGGGALGWPWLAGLALALGLLPRRRGRA